MPLLQTLMVMGYPVRVDEELENPLDHNHKKQLCDITIGNDIGFRWNDKNNSYELVADLMSWSLDVPPERFINKVTQNYSLENLLETAKEEGYEVVDQTVNDRQEVELTVSRWC